MALLCVIHNKQCCDADGAITADFHYPNGTHVAVDDAKYTHGVYITKGGNIVRLNYADVGVAPPSGPYCCSVDDTGKIDCIYIDF